MHTNISDQQTTDLVKKIATDIESSGWEPEMIVGIARGGLVPATMLSYRFECDMQPLVWQTSKGSAQESNLWLPEDAVAGKHILIVDNVVRTGTTLQQIMSDWDLSVVNNIDWGQGVKFACLHRCVDSEIMPQYVGDTITSTQQMIYPWENLNG